MPFLTDLKPPLKERLSGFLHSAEVDYGVNIRITCTLRSAMRAQELHIAHMIRYNSFDHRITINHEPQKPHVIKFSHLVNVDIARSGWRGVDWRKYLRTKLGHIPQIGASGEIWLKGFEPDEIQTRNEAYKILASAVSIMIERQTCHIRGWLRAVILDVVSRASVGAARLNI
jgi:hypothetical protein